MRPSLPELKEYAKGYQLVPVYKTIKAGEKQPVDLLRKLKNYSHKLFMLEHTNHDAAGNVVWDRYSYLGITGIAERHTKCICSALGLRCFCKDCKHTVGIKATGL